MATEKFANNPTTTLNGAINNSVTSITVTSATTFPTTGNFRILIDSEILLVTAVSGTTFTVTRGAEGTTAVTHADLASVDGIVTKGSLDALRSDLISNGTFAGKPTTEIAGRLYLVNDGSYLLRDTGSIYETYGPIHKFIPPDDSQFSWVNQGSATISTAGGLLYLSNPGDNASL